MLCGGKSIFLKVRKISKSFINDGGAGGEWGRKVGCILNGMALTDDETILVTKQLVINENLV